METPYVIGVVTVVIVVLVVIYYFIVDSEPVSKPVSEPVKPVSEPAPKEKLLLLHHLNDVINEVWKAPNCEVLQLMQNEMINSLKGMSQDEKSLFCTNMNILIKQFRESSISELNTYVVPGISCDQNGCTETPAEYNYIDPTLATQLDPELQNMKLSLINYIVMLKNNLCVDGSLNTTKFIALIKNMKANMCNTNFIYELNNGFIGTLSRLSLVPLLNNKYTLVPTIDTKTRAINNKVTLNLLNSLVKLVNANNKLMCTTEYIEGLKTYIYTVIDSLNNSDVETDNSKIKCAGLVNYINSLKEYIKSETNENTKKLYSDIVLILEYVKKSYCVDGYINNVKLSKVIDNVVESICSRDYNKAIKNGLIGYVANRINTVLSK